MKDFLKVLLGYVVLANFMASIITVIAMVLLSIYELPTAIAPLVGCAFLVAYYAVRRKHMSRTLAMVNTAVTILLAVAFTLLMLIADGGINSMLVTALLWAAFPFYPLVLLSLVGDFSIVFASMFLLLLAGWLMSILLLKDPVRRRMLAAVLAVGVVAGCVCAKLYVNRPEVRYAGHGFQYMHGYSSTDFSDYMVYSEDSKLAALDHVASLRIEKEKDMPVMDGAEACYPLYAAVAKAVYADIDQIEQKPWQDEKDEYTNGHIVTFTNSVQGMYRLEFGEADLFFGARPSMDQMAEAEADGRKLRVTPIGREGFVFFVEADNPIDNLTSQQIRDIYSGKITNWSEVGGQKQKIVAFQRPQYSGSQTMMEYFMGETPLMEPKSYERVGSMDGVVKRVAEYSSEDGAFGYTFRYFLEGLNQEPNVKMISIDGVTPTREHIADGTYPLTTSLCLITREDNSNPYVEQMIEFMLSEDGQYLVEQTGYGRLN